MQTQRNKTRLTVVLALNIFIVATGAWSYSVHHYDESLLVILLAVVTMVLAWHEMKQ